VFSVQFGCAPAAVDKLVDAAFAEIAAIAKSGIDASYLAKVKQLYLRERETAMKTNRYWVDELGRAARYGDDPKGILDTDATIARMTSDNVKAAAARYLDRKITYQAVMMPLKR
jgi:zinc protease